ncbi:MAG TPA: sugar-binding domain-containing protein [Acidobacteriaceae bacterium]
MTRRAAMQGMAGAVMATALPVHSFAMQTSKSGLALWPEAVADAPQRLQPFNDNWRFHRGDAEGAETAGFDHSSWRVLDVPHDWSIEDLPPGGVAADAIWTDGTTPTRNGPFDRYESAGGNATGWTVGGVGWYRKTFARPENVAAGGKVELRFEGVYMNSDVWINGVHLGNHPYGYTEFAYDLTSHLKDGENAVAIRANNSGRNSRWYSGSGIYRKVWLNSSGELRVPHYGVSITTPEVAADRALVNVAVTIESGAATTRHAAVWVRLMDGTTAVAEGNRAVIVQSGASQMAMCALQVRNPRLWSPNDPQLYRAEVAIVADGKVADSTSLTVGVRKVEIDAVNGLRINGESFKMRGGCVHHDNGPLGSACIPRAEERRVEKLKANGYNAIRTSHNPPSRDFLDACDRLGMMVMDEAFDCWEIAKNPDDYHLYFDEWWKRDLESMVLRDRNHPSVVLWSIGNEIDERAVPRGVELGTQMRDYVHQLEPTRKVTAAISGPWDHPNLTWEDMQPAFAYLDVGGYNYKLSQYEPDHAKYPERVIVGTETFPAEVYKDWQVIDRSSWVIGDFVWTAIDYMGEAGTGRTSIRNGERRPGAGGPAASGAPWFNAYCGDIDLVGNKKAASYFRDVVWRRSAIEMAVQRPLPKGYTEAPAQWGWSDELRSWTWPGYEGALLAVRVYTRAGQVKLLLNGKEVGSKGLTEQDGAKAEFIVPYAPGELKAVAYQDGREVASIVFATAGAAHSLVLTADRPKLKASRDDLSYIMAMVVDQAGRPVPDAVVPVTFTIRGVGEIAAVGNGNPKDLSSFRQPHKETFHGQCVVVVRPNGGAGTVEVRAQSAGLEEAAIALNVSA